MRAVAASAERIEAEAFVQLLLALPPDLKTRIGAQVVRRGSAISLITPGGGEHANPSRASGRRPERRLTQNDSQIRRSGTCSGLGCDWLYLQPKYLFGSPPAM